MLAELLGQNRKELSCPNILYRAKMVTLDRQSYSNTVYLDQMLQNIRTFKLIWGL